MSTNSTIWIENKNDKYIGIYCHWDGYPSHNGRILHDYYSNETAIRALIALGDISSLGTTINSPKEKEEGSVEFTKAYCRDLLEDYSSLSALIENLTKTEEFNYLWKDGAWYCAYEDGAYKLLESSDFID